MIELFYHEEDEGYMTINKMKINLVCNIGITKEDLADSMFSLSDYITTEAAAIIKNGKPIIKWTEMPPTED